MPGGSLAIRPIAEHHITGYAQQWNFGVQHELGNGLLATASYVGTRGRQMFRNHNINYPRTVGTALVRPYDGFSSIMMMDPGPIPTTTPCNSRLRSVSRGALRCWPHTHSARLWTRRLPPRVSSTMPPATLPTSAAVGDRLPSIARSGWW